MEYLILEGLKFHSFIGHFDEEKYVGSNFEIDLKIKVNLLPAGKSDDLNDTVNYVELYSVIKQIMSKKSNLIEHIAYQIIDTLFNKFEPIQQIDLIVKKLDTQIGGQYTAVATQFVFDRKQWFEKIF